MDPNKNDIGLMLTTVLLTVVLLFPILILLNRNFRLWIKQGIVGDDGILQIEEVESMIQSWASVVCLLIFGITFVVDILGGRFNETVCYLSFSGFASTELVRAVQAFKSKKQNETTK